MAFIEKTAVGNTNGVTDVDLMAGSASVRMVAKAVTVYNADTVSHGAILKLDVSGTDTILCKATVGPGATLVYELPVVVDGTARKLQIVLSEAKTTTDCAWSVTYAEVS